MRSLALLLALATTILGCEKFCEVNPDICMPPAPAADDGEDAPPAPPAPTTEAPAPDALLPDAGPDATLDAAMLDATTPTAAIAIFTWHRNGAALGEQTRELSLVARCVDRNGNAIPFFQPPESRTYAGEEIHNVEEINLTIPYGEHPTATKCRGLLRQNENETPFGGAEQPGSGTYVLDDGVVYNAPLVDEGYWEVDLYPAAD